MDERLQLLHGPYAAPACTTGDVLECEVRGEVVVRGWLGGPIPWPYALAGKARAVIVCGDLARAARVEAEQAVAHWWGLSRSFVTRLRRKLGVPRFTAGTARLFRDLTPLSRGEVPWDAREEAAVRSLRPAEAAALTGRTERAVACKRRRLGLPVLKRRWTPEEDELVLRLPPAEAAARTGRSPNAVHSRRRRLGLTI